MTEQSAADLPVPPDVCLSCALLDAAPVVAEYEWTHPSGNVTRLCVECCARWRQQATGEIGTFNPIRIRSIAR